MNRDLLTEAIADAKAVKEMAIANAKAALEEAFTPHLKSMLSQKLNEMDVEEVEDKMEETYDDSMAEVEEGYGKKKMEEENLEEILAELDEDMDKDMKEEMHKSMDEEMDKDMKEEMYKGMEEDMDKNMEETMKVYEEEDEMELEDMSEEELKNLIEDVIEDMVKAGELEAGEKFGDEEEEEMDLEMKDDEAGEEMEAEEEISIDELLSELESLEEKKDEATMEEGKKMEIEEEEKMKEEMKKKDRELEEAYEAVTTLKSELQEVNLLNSKLLYTNKIFRNKNLTETQKVKVLSTFDRAETVKEVKLVYETLSESLRAKTATPIKESLGGASKAAGVAPKRQIVESNEAFTRMQKLAGIIK